MKFSKGAVNLLFIICVFMTLCNCNNVVSNLPEPYSTHNQPVINNDVYVGDTNVGGMTKEQVEKVLTDYSVMVNIPKKEPSYNEKDWEEVTDGEEGKKLNIEKTMRILVNAEEGEKIEPVIELEVPEHTLDEAKSKIKKIASFETQILDAEQSRINNISLACECIDGIVLNPGDVFSFNEIVGETTKAKGYMDADIYVKDKTGKVRIEDAPGGGICQVSSTLYNAVDACSLKTIERHEHSKEVGYVPKGRDASISIGTRDFKFQNSKQNRIMIKMRIENKNVVAYILENESN